MILYLSDTAANDNDKTFTNSAHRQWNVKSIYVKMVTQTDVGNRNMAVRFLDGAGATIGEFRAGAVQANATTRYYHFTPSATDLTGFRDTDFLSTPIPDIPLPKNFAVQVLDDNDIGSSDADDMSVWMIVDAIP
jgi:hypothetical protein